MLTTSGTALKNAQKRLSKKISKNQNLSKETTTEDEANEDDHELLNELFATEPQIPDAVYFCSIEPPSISSQNAMEQALRQLQREDPSLRVSHDEVTGQTVLGGE